MKHDFWVKFVIGLILVVFLIALCYQMSDWLVTVLGNVKNGDDVLDDEYVNELYTPEPAPTIPDYMQEDTFYDNAGSVDFDGE